VKQKICGGAVLAVSLWLAGGALSVVEARPKPARPGVKVGLVDSLLRNNTEKMSKVLLDKLKPLFKSQTGLSGPVLLAGDALALGQKLKDGEVQVGAFHGFEFAWARQKYPTLKPILIAVNKGRYFQAKVVVHKDATGASVSDFKGKKAALAKNSREHVRLFFERRCVKANVPPARFFSQVTSPNDTEDALDDVVDGKAQLAIVDAVELEDYFKAKPGRARRLKTLVEGEKVPGACIAYQPGRLSEATVARFRKGLTAARNNPKGREMLELMRISGFEAVPDDYEASLAAVLKLYPPPAAVKPR
jgi:ABC-type phosphate/phosphonate transport system substrate-binding protein